MMTEDLEIEQALAKFKAEFGIDLKAEWERIPPKDKLKSVRLGIPIWSAQLRELAEQRKSHPDPDDFIAALLRGDFHNRRQK
jgi:hypothetical protein